MSASPISSQLLCSSRELFFREFNYCSQFPENKISEINLFAPNSIIYFPIAINVWEAVINETFLSITTEWHFKNHPAINIIDKMEKWDIKSKTIKLPKLFLNADFDSNSEAYKKFIILLEIRNAITHFKYKSNQNIIKLLKDLVRLEVIPEINENWGWYCNLFSTECIRFCLNTVYEMMVELNKCIANENIFNLSMYFSTTKEELMDFINGRPIKGVSTIFNA
jgi:hypothetical protein